ncbi:hypothetical protein ACRSLK_07670 [Halopseudomonas pachastrellae]|uniref:hypothetical protein n=1 Tax=Halopseudomonas pachastrellae TaxID=254161 RepID=UPI003D7EB868
MTRWSEQPPSPDFLDLILERLPPLLSRHSSLLLKVMPPFLGFALFLQYFYRNQFYPSFELSQFSSLLLAAACIGVLIVGFVVVLLVAPGIVIFHGYLNNADVKERITNGLPEKEEERQRRVLELVVLTYVGPILCAGIAFWPLLLLLPDRPVILALGTFTLIAAIFGVLTTKRFNLPRRTITAFFWTSFVSIALFITLTGVVGSNLAPHLSDLPTWVQIAGLLAAVLVLTFASSISAMANVAGWYASLLFSTFYGLMICTFCGLLTALPETAVRSVGIGAYEAKSVELDPSFCDTGIGVRNDQSCRLESPDIVWSLGETLVLRTNGNDPVQLQIPSRQVKAIVQYPD